MLPSTVKPRLEREDNLHSTPQPSGSVVVVVAAASAALFVLQTEVLQLSEKPARHLPDA